MRLVVTGLGDDGRSTVTWVGEADSFLADGVPVRNQVWEWIPGVMGHQGPAFDIDCPGGAIQWRVIRWSGAHETQMHRTDTVDIQTVVHGSAELILESGSVRLTVGDCVVVPGVEHRWQVDAGGCTLNTILIGVAPSAA